MARLREQHTPFYAAKESAAGLADLRANRLIFLYSDLPHNEVVHQRQQFRDYLKTSCCAARETAAAK